MGVCLFLATIFEIYVVVVLLFALRIKKTVRKSSKIAKCQFWDILKTHIIKDPLRTASWCAYVHCTYATAYSMQNLRRYAAMRDCDPYRRDAGNLYEGIYDMFLFNEKDCVLLMPRAVLARAFLWPIGWCMVAAAEECSLIGKKNLFRPKKKLKLLAFPMHLHRKRKSRTCKATMPRRIMKTINLLGAGPWSFDTLALLTLGPGNWKYFVHGTIKLHIQTRNKTSNRWFAHLS